MMRGGGDFELYDKDTKRPSKSRETVPLNGPKRCASASSIAKMWCKGKNIPPRAKNLKILHENTI
jgi:hypothetical protein